MIDLFSFGAGAIIGCFLGVFAMALGVISRRGDVTERDLR